MTDTTKLNDIKREWHLVDVKEETLGRVSTKIAQLLMGKSKPYFVRNLDCGDYAVVVNAKDIKVTGKKETQKKYYAHSVYPAGFKAAALQALRARNPTDIIKHAVAGMLPQDKLNSDML